jgi:hypothetical protein
MSKGNPMSIAAGAVGAIAVASAVYLTLDLSDPYSGALPYLVCAARAGAGDQGQGVGHARRRCPRSDFVLPFVGAGDKGFQCDIDLPALGPRR